MNKSTIALAAGLLGALSLGGCAAGVGYGDPYGPGIYNEGYGLGFGYDYGFDPYHDHSRYDRYRGYRRSDRFGRNRFEPGDRAGHFVEQGDGRLGGPGRHRIIIPGRGGPRPDGGH